MLKIRSRKQIKNAENEKSELVWYLRHRILEEAGRLGSNKAIVKKARVGSQRVEKKYGGGKPLCICNSCYSRLEGELAALRWVLGDKWGNFDS